jgi:hypothetical protein
MSRRRSPLLLLVLLSALAVLLAACGNGSRSGSGAAHHDSGSADRAATDTGTAGPLKVTATDLRLGDASVGSDATPLRKLPGRHRIDPDELRADQADRDGVGAGATCPDQDLMPAPDNLPAVIASTLCLLNGERADAGLPPLSSDAKLAAAALEHSQDMVAKQYFAHDSLDGRDVVDRIKASGYLDTDRRWTIGENLAWGTGTLATPRNIVSAWMHSEGHRENILRPVFNEIGFGVVVGNPRATDGAGATYSTDFGSLGTTASSTDVASAGTTTTITAKPVSQTTKAKKAKKKAKAKAKKAKARKARARAAARRRARAARRHARRLHARATRAASGSAAS